MFNPGKVKLPFNRAPHPDSYSACLFFLTLNKTMGFVLLSLVTCQYLVRQYLDCRCVLGHERGRFRCPFILFSNMRCDTPLCRKTNLGRGLKKYTMTETDERPLIFMAVSRDATQYLRLISCYMVSSAFRSLEWFLTNNCSAQ